MASRGPALVLLVVVPIVEVRVVGDREPTDGDQPICWGEAASAVAIGAIERTRCGYIAPTETAMPPMEPPTTPNHASTPR